jgi:hypothetical protein
MTFTFFHLPPRRINDRFKGFFYSFVFISTRFSERREISVEMEEKM